MYTGKKVRLREYKEEDTVKALQFINDIESRGYLQKGVPYPYTLNDEKAFIEGATASKDNYNFAIETLDGVFIGGCGLNRVDWKNRVVSIGIFIGHKKYWSRGFGTDAMNVFLKFIFEEMNIHRVEVGVFSFNERAIRVYEKLGFTREGVMRECLFKGGKYHDEIIMSMLKREYQPESK